MSENSQVRTQAPDITDLSVLMNTTFASTSEAERKAREKPRFLEFACHHVEVSFAQCLSDGALMNEVGVSLCCGRYKGSNSALNLG